MPVHKIELIPGGVRVYKDSIQFFEGRASDFPGNAEAKAAALKVAFQDWFDVRIPRADLVADDPDKMTDPALPNIFWDGTDLLSRSVEVTDVVITGSGQNVAVNVALKRIR